jgi:hypothetical protein
MQKEAKGSVTGVEDARDYECEVRKHVQLPLRKAEAQ